MASYPRNHGKKWSSWDIQCIKNEFQNGDSIREIAFNHDRTAYSIAWRLYELNLIDYQQRESIKNYNTDIRYTRNISISAKTNYINASSRRISSRPQQELISNERKQEIKDFERLEKLLDYNTFGTSKETYSNKKRQETSETGFLETFLVLWFFILIANQVFIFRACFKLYCIIAAMPHTSIIALIITFLLVAKDKKT